MRSVKRGGSFSGSSLSNKTSNKMRRQNMFVRQKKEASKQRHNERRQRKKYEMQDPELRRERLNKNKTITLESKREWDGGDSESFFSSVDVAAVRWRRLEEEKKLAAEEADAAMEVDDNGDEDVDSMLGSGDEGEEGELDKRTEKNRSRRAQSNSSIAASMKSTNMELTASLAPRFPTLFNAIPERPKILLTTSLHGTIHKEAVEIASLFPNSEYIPRSGHKHSYKYSIREIARFAKNRGFTALVVVKEERKVPVGMTIIHLNSNATGPTFTYSISNYMPGKKLPGHGNPTNHYPEILLNNFRTPLGLLAAKSLQVLYGPPELQGRQVVTFHNQRDYVFVRRHRYVFRDKRETERSVLNAEGKEMTGMEQIRAGLQELGPRFTIKLRRVDKGVGKAGSEGGDGMPWSWHARMDKKRTRFSL